MKAHRNQSLKLAFLLDRFLISDPVGLLGKFVVNRTAPIVVVRRYPANEGPALFFSELIQCRIQDLDYAFSTRLRLHKKIIEESNLSTT